MPLLVVIVNAGATLDLAITGLEVGVAVLVAVVALIVVVLAGLIVIAIVLLLDADRSTVAAVPTSPAAVADESAADASAVAPTLRQEMAVAAGDLVVIQQEPVVLVCRLGLTPPALLGQCCSVNVGG